MLRRVEIPHWSKASNPRILYNLCILIKKSSSLKRHIDIPSNDDGIRTIWLKHLFSRTCGAANTLPRCLRWPLHQKSISYTCPYLLARIWSCFYEAVSSSFGSTSVLRVTISTGASIFQLWYSDRKQDDCLCPRLWLKSLNKISINQWDDSAWELQFCRYEKCPIWSCRRQRSFFITAPLNLLKMPRKDRKSVV